MLPKKEEIRDKVVLVGLNSPVLREDSATEESMDELSALVETAGGETAGIVLQNRATLLDVTKCTGLLVQAELLVELSHASAGIDQLLLASEEGVTLRADFHLDITLGRTCLNHITAGASNRSLLIIGMDSFLHCSRSPLSGTKLPLWSFHPTKAK